IEFVKRTKGKISSNIKIYFAGKGPDEKALIDEIKNSNQYIVLGFIDVYKELYNYDYVCLFSKKEGLPLSLIDGCMFAKPLITNDIKSVLDINMNGYNGFVVSDWEGLIECINNLPLPGTGEYHRLSFNSRKVYENKFLFYAMIDNYKKYLSMF
ncbi:glycosyltransferase, partial [Parabacteroides distasonis]